MSGERFHHYRDHAEGDDGFPTSAERDETRLTEDDRMAMRAAIRRTVVSWNASHGPRELGADLVALTRIAAHAIGCGTHDLRESELSAIETYAYAALTGECSS